MKKTYKRISFDAELAKKIQSGEVKGRILTNNGREVSILCFDRKSVSSAPIVALVHFSPSDDQVHTYSETGYMSDIDNDKGEFDLHIELPEEMLNKRGELIIWPHPINPNRLECRVCSHYRCNGCKYNKYEYRVGDKIKVNFSEERLLEMKINGCYQGNILTVTSIQPYGVNAKGGNIKETFFMFDDIEPFEFKVGDYVKYGKSGEKLKIVKIDNSLPSNVWVEVETLDGNISMKCPLCEIEPYEEPKEEFKVGDKVIVHFPEDNLEDDYEEKKYQDKVLVVKKVVSGIETVLFVGGGGLKDYPINAAFIKHYHNGFKVGDKVKYYNSWPTYEIITINDNEAILKNEFGKTSPVPLESLELVIEKQEFKPFDKVLVRGDGERHWQATFFSHYSECEPVIKYCTASGWWKYCIPYEGNEHLVGTTNNPK